MADNKLLLRRGSDEDFLAEDDPLAELARIVGFEPVPAQKPAPSMRREPVFDLEDELLKELEIYSRPAVPDIVATPEPVTALAVERAPAPAPVPLPAIEPESIAPAAPIPEPVAPVRAPVVLEAVETFADPEEGRVYERPASHPVFDLEDEILREFAAFDARSVTAHVEHVVEAEVVHQIQPSLAELPAELHEVPERSVNMHAEGRELYDSFFDDDLHAAISDAVAHSLDEPVETVADPILDAVSEQEAPFEELEERAAVNDGYWAAPVAVADAIADEEPLISADSADIELPAIDFAAHAVEQRLEPTTRSWDGYDDAIKVPAIEPAPMPVEKASLGAVAFTAPTYPPANDYGLDDLLAEVERFPVGDSSGRWSVQSRTASNADASQMVPPVVQDFAPMAVLPDLPARIDAVPAPPSVAQDVVEESPAIEHLPDIDLGAVELELSDIQEDDFTLSPDLLSAIGGVVLADTSPGAPDDIAEPPVAVVAERALEPSDYSSLPFDPSQIIPEEDVVEAIAEIDVPDVPMVHEEERPAPHPEYDIDLDAEMAQLFVTATAPAVASLRNGQAPDIAAAPQKIASATIDLDEFERALEEDFRRSFSENRATSSPGRMPLAPAATMPVPGGNRRRTLLLAGAAVLIAVFGGAGVFAFMSGDTQIMASSEPKVILADTDPVKVLPENPGGKEVPNQNKAVYDRVAGAKVDETKQESLVTSNEEPIDVVQRTLEPENLPMDDDAMAMATPTDDTADPRLLPDQAEQDRVTTTSKVLSGVSPRKVKTMVVRPDGTLVERDVTEEDMKQQATNDAELMKIAQKAAQDAATASDSQADDIAKTIENVPERLSPSDEQAVTPVEAKPVEAKAVVAETDPVLEADPVETTKPVVTEDPVAADEPVAAVEKTDLKTVQVEDKPTDRSLPAEDQQATSDTDAAAKVAAADVEDAPVRKVKTTKITPVPEIRPVDQPVHVVGRVTDQGTVQDAAESKPQQVALADQNAETPVETTPLPAGSYVIQIASLPSEAEAEASYSKLSSKFGGIIGGKGVDIRKAEIKNKGTYYRVRIPAGSKQEAQNLCAQYKKAGGSCLVSK